MRDRGASPLAVTVCVLGGLTDTVALCPAEHRWTGHCCAERGEALSVSLSVALSVSQTVCLSVGKLNLSATTLAYICSPGRL